MFRRGAGRLSSSQARKSGGRPHGRSGGGRAGVLRRRHLHSFDHALTLAVVVGVVLALDWTVGPTLASSSRSGGARRAGPARVLPLCPGPVARDELPRGDGRATARAAAPNGPALEVEELRHRYGERIALDGVSLRVERGELFGLLGPNGGGKSTLFRILSTLLAAGGGAARVLGHDVAREPDRVRRRLGVVFQHASVDRTLTVQENLVHHGHLYGLSGASLRAAVEAVTGRLGLAERRRDRVGTLSGGLQRRTELAKALLVGAELLLLDEPTSGLDPAARREFLGFLAELRAADGITIVLTTHDMEEAERCDRVAILDRGRLVALGAPEALRAQVGGDVLVVAGPDPARLAERVRERFGLAGRLVDGTLRLERARGHELVRDLIEAFPEEVRTVSYGKPTLDDVFIHLTGHRLAEA